MNAVCNKPWPSDAVVRFANAFRDVSLSDDLARLVVDKLLRHFERIVFDELPALVYQLLLLSSKVFLFSCSIVLRI